MVMMVFGWNEHVLVPNPIHRRIPWSSMMTENKLSGGLCGEDETVGVLSCSH